MAKPRGRPIGRRNNDTRSIKDAVLRAAENAGGGCLVTYLEDIAKNDPKTFMPLLCKLVPYYVESKSEKLEHKVTEIIYTPKITDKREIIDVEAKELVYKDGEE